MKESNRILNPKSAVKEAAANTGLRALSEEMVWRNELEEEVSRLKERAEAAHRAQSVFLDNMSHEIRTPLTSIIGFASALVQQGPGKYQEYARRIEEDGYRLLDTLNAMLMLAQLEANGVDLHLEWLPVSRDIQEIVRHFESQAQKKGLTLTLHVQREAEQAIAHLDRDALSRIMQNLIHNAIKFTAQGGITVEVTTDVDLACVCMRVQDTGVGIDPAFMPHLFEAFRQESTGMSRSHEGTGLGLAITKRFVELLHGTITVESEQGKGSVFSVCFPLHGVKQRSRSMSTRISLAVKGLGR